MEDAVAPDDRALAQRHLRIDMGPRADLAALAYEDLGLYHGVVAYHGAFLYDGKGAHVDAGSEAN